MAKIKKIDADRSEVDIRVTLLIPVADILEEVQRGEEMHGRIPRDKMRAVAILVEEVGEVAQAALEIDRPLPRDGDATEVIHERMRHYREELVQVAAVALRMVEAIDEQ